MIRLNIDDQRARNKNLMNFGLDYLVAEKAKVKAELKRFDNEFQEMFHRLPNRNEKEVMRILYMYYKNLKVAISQKQAGSTSKQLNVNNSITDNALTNNYMQSKKSSYPDNKNQNYLNTTHNSNPNPNLNNIYSFNNIYTINENAQEITTKEKKTANYSNLLSHNSNFNTVNASKDRNSIENSNKIGLNANLNENKQNPNELFDINKESKTRTALYPKDKKYTKSELIQMEKEYQRLRKEQLELKQKLHNYQKEFFEIHNRRVKYYKDIIGVEDEYNKYKENKAIMKEIQEVIMQYKNSK